jgi:hypothetical protein
MADDRLSLTTTARSNGIPKTSGQTNNARFPFQPEGNAGSNERNIWRSFESYKRSTVLHIEQYLQYDHFMNTNQGAKENAEAMIRGKYASFILYLL